MKKRIALAAAIALAISVGGMLPASAAKLGAPVITSSGCTRAGGTLEVKAKVGNVTVALDEAKPGYLSITSPGDGSDEPTCSTSDTTLAISGLTSVVVKAAGTGFGNVLIDLSNGTDVYNYGSIPMTIQAAAGLVFDGSQLAYTGGLKSFSGVFGEETFTIGSVTGSYYAASLAFNGGTGADVLDASGVATTDVTLSGGTGNDTLKGGAGDDTLYGGTSTPGGDDGDDVLYGTAGDDKLFTSDGGTSCNTPSDNSSDKAAKCTSSAGGIDEAWGGAGDDLITADAADTVAPGDGMDLLTGSAYQLNYSDSSAAISINLTTLPGLVKSDAGSDYYTAGNVAQFVGSGLADTMVGSSANDSGVGGADRFYGGKGADKMLGGSGSDFLSGNGGADTIKGGAGNDTILGDTGADVINGGNGNDTVRGGIGDDVIYGSAGDDILFGDKGSDQTWGGKGTFDVCAAEVTDSCEFKR